MDLSLFAAAGILLLIYVAVPVLFILGLMYVLRSLSGPSRTEAMGYKGWVAERVEAVGFHEADFREAYKAGGVEHLIFLADGLISDRYGLIYVPYRNIDSATKESDGKSYLITLRGGLPGRGCVALSERISGRYPLAITIRRVLSDDEMLSLKKSIDEDGGIVIFESIEKASMPALESSLKRFGLAITEVAYKPT